MSLRHRAYIGQKHAQHLFMRNIFALNGKQRNAIKKGSKIFANSLPKSGTHLLRHILEMLPNVIDKWTYHFDHQICDCKVQLAATMPGQIVSAHMYWSSSLTQFLKNNDFKTFLMVRDLRDICVSSAHYCTKDTRHRLYKHMNSLDTWSERLSAVVKGINGEDIYDGVRSKSIGEHVDGYMPWIRDSNCLVVKFEDLVGVKGGGDLANQKKAIQRISDHLDLDITELLVTEIADKAFTAKTKTFRQGKVGEWRKEFDENNIALFKQVAGQNLIELNYEISNEW